MWSVENVDYMYVKTVGLTKFSLNFTSLAVWFASGYVRLAVSIFFSRLRKS